MEPQPAIGVPRNGPAVDAGGIVLIVVTICVFLLPILIYFPPMLPSKSEALLQTHTPIGLTATPRSRSFLSVFGRRRVRAVSGDSSEHPTGAAQIRNLCIYPVKSCKGIEVTESKVLPAGLEFDRLFMFAQLRSPFPVSLDTPEDEKSRHIWDFVTQRQFPLLATVSVDLFVPDVAKAAVSNGDDNAYLILRFPWVESGVVGALAWLVAKLSRGWRALPEKEVLLPVMFPPQDEIAARGYTYEQVTIWRETVTALNMETELPRELRLYLGVSNRLGIFRVDPARLRDVYRCAPTGAEAGYQPCTGFQDAYPLHLLNLSSVRDLEAKLEKDDDLRQLDPGRFRANIIIDGPGAYEEETWKKIVLRPVPRTKSVHATQPCQFHVSCRTVRCKMPNVDQETGHRHPVEPDRSLRKFRDVDPGAKKKGCLGMQLTPLFDLGKKPKKAVTCVDSVLLV
ncbi:molybdenum cofactor sulfurase [Echria macrotheca]|uniref:Molybdenum cofactor sulfurase n=1 Tax=Echria macrotheca TaxID=438768 RepID=A0AAJ0BK72_9PEZI|nr:molybdenum cofactor sulfurase [Echria macrotheca]